MQPFFEDYLAVLEKLHGEIKGAIKNLPQAALDWVPGPGMNSVCVLVVHIAGAQRYWIGEVAAGDPSERDRESEFRAQGLDTAELEKRLTDSLAYARSALEPMTAQDLEKRCVSPRHGPEVGMAWALVHAMEHTAQHLGHIQLTRQFWEQQQRAE